MTEGPSGRNAFWTVRLLALARVALALICVALAVAWTRKADEAACWRQALADDDTVSAVDCVP